MKTKIYLLAFLLLLNLGLTSCNNDDDGKRTSISVNDFVWKALNSWYYWQEEVPYLADNRFSSDEEYMQFIESKSTDDLFFSLLYNYGTTDRFSWIVPDYHTLENQFAGINLSFGMKYGLVYINSNSSNLFGYVQYIIPNSPAANAGLKRGDIFMKINGNQLTDFNYTELLASQTATFGMGYLENGQIYSTNQEVTLTKVELQENPVYLTKVFNQGGHKIGYIVYNAFRANFNDELNDAIGQLSAQGITDMILDLRYNGGGSVETSTYLGSMLTGQFNGQDFTRIVFNSKAAQNNKSYIFENTGKVYNDDLTEVGTFGLNHLQLNQLTVLTARGTASASEMLISCLKPYISVNLVGTKTYGKTVGSITLYDSPSSAYTSTNNINPSHTWAMQPIVFEYRNSLDHPSPTMGIPTDVEVNEIQYLENLPELGNPSEPLLAAALNDITGSAKVKKNSANFSEESVFKTSQTMDHWGTEMYLNKGFAFNP